MCVAENYNTQIPYQKKIVTKKKKGGQAKTFSRLIKPKIRPTKPNFNIISLNLQWNNTKINESVYT